MKINIAKVILEELKTKDEITSNDLEIQLDVLHGILLSLKNSEQIDFFIKETFEKFLTEEGREVINNGSQEFNLYSLIGDNGSDKSILNKFPHGSRHAFKNGWIKLKDEMIYKKKNDVCDFIVENLKNLTIISEKEFQELKKEIYQIKKKTCLFY